MWKDFLAANERHALHETGSFGLQLTDEDLLPLFRPCRSFGAKGF
jgi:hypothetical protein